MKLLNADVDADVMKNASLSVNASADMNVNADGNANQNAKMCIRDSINARTESTYRGDVALSYIANKVRQGDEDGMVGLTEMDGITVLQLKQEINGSEYVTYIYYRDCLLYTSTMPQYFARASVFCKALTEPISARQVSAGSLFITEKGK